MNLTNVFTCLQQGNLATLIYISCNGCNKENNPIWVLVSSQEKLALFKINSNLDQRDHIKTGSGNTILACIFPESEVRIPRNFVIFLL